MVNFNNPKLIATTATGSAALTKGKHNPVDATTGALAMTLPTTAAAGVEVSVEKVDSSANIVTVSGTFRGSASTITLTSQYEARTFLSEGAGSWRPVSDHRTAASLSASILGGVVPPSVPMQPWATAFAGRDSALASITVISDSTAEGVGISSLSARWTERLRDGLRTRYPVTGVTAGQAPDYIPAYYDTQGNIGTASPAATAGVTKSTSWGLGRRAMILPATTTNDTITFSMTTCTRFKVLVAKNSSSAVMGVTVDGGTETQVSLAQTNAGGFVAVDSGALTSGTHTVVIRRVSGGTVTVEGVLRYGGDDAKGVRVLDGSHSGNANSHFGGATAWAASCGVEQPDLVIHGLIYNDYLNRVPMASFPGYVTATRDAVRAAATSKTPSYLYLILPEPQYTNGTAAVAPWSDYVAAVKTAASTDPLGLSAVLDLSTRIPAWATGSTFGMPQADKIHPTDKGAAWIADAVERYITRL